MIHTKDLETNYFSLNNPNFQPLVKNTTFKGPFVVINNVVNNVDFRLDFDNFFIVSEAGNAQVTFIEKPQIIRKSF